MALEVLINGVDYACTLFRNSMMIREAMQVNGSSLTGKIQIAAPLTVPQGGNHIKVLRDNVLEFAGRIVSIESERPGNAVQYVIECVDYTPDFDAQLIAETFEEPTIGDLIRVIVGFVGRGFTSNNVVNGPDTSQPLEAELETPSSLVTKLAESVEHQWYIDYERDLHFFYIRERPAPVTSIDFDTNLTDASDLEVTEDVSQVKNVIYLTGAQVESPRFDSIGWEVHGDQTFFPLNYQPISIPKTTVTVNNAPVTLGLDGVDSQAGDGGSQQATAYLCIPNWGVRFPDNSPPGNEETDTTVAVAYKYAYDAVVKVEEPRSIELMKARENAAGAPSNGRHEFKFHVPDLGIVESESVIVDYGNLLLSRYAFPIYSIRFVSLTQGWARGQMFRAVSARFGLDTDMFITGVSKTIWQSSEGQIRFKYIIEATSSPFPP